MSLSGVLTSDLRDLYKSGMRETFEFLGIQCTIQYVPKKNKCPNCIPNVAGGMSSSRYNGTGSSPFSFGLCPICNSLGFLEIENSDTINLQIAWEPKTFIDPFRAKATALFPKESVQVKGNFADLPKLKQAKEIWINNPLRGYVKYIFKVASEAVPAGMIQTDYFIMLLERI